MSFPYEGSYRPSVDQHLCKAIFLINVYGFPYVLSHSYLLHLFQSNESSSLEIIDTFIFICICNIYKQHTYIRGETWQESVKLTSLWTW